jgi:hypothetical protein
VRCKTRRPWVALVGAVATLVVLAPAAGAKERVLTLYSPRIDSLPYVHDTHELTLRADGRQAPAKPGFLLGFKETALVDSKRPDAKLLPLSKMMVHHFVYFAPGRVDDDVPGGCWSGLGFIGGRGEEHPLGRTLREIPEALRDRYGIRNRLPDGSAPDWHLTAMVMNHYKRPKSFYIRTRVYYTTERREAAKPVVFGDCSLLANGMAYDVPGGGALGSTYVDESIWTAPFSGRLLVAFSHQHGGGRYQLLESRTCGRRLFKAPVYHGRPGHVYNTIRPILHEPGPIGNGSYATVRGIPIAEGEVLRRVAVHDNHNLHVAAMGFWATLFDRTPNYDLVVPQLAKPTGAFRPFTGGALAVEDGFFTPQKVTAAVGETVTWRFVGSAPHTVTVANGPRGFSSLYWGQTAGSYSFAPQVPGTYRLVCLVHPTTMAQTLEVR